MKVKINHKKQLSRIICSASGAVQTVSGRSNAIANKSVVQMLDVPQTEEQIFDKKGIHKSKGQTNPPHLVNTLNGNTYNTLIQDASGTNFHNAHMMAATFGGKNDLKNIAAWSVNMETAWSNAENDIRGVIPSFLKRPRKEEEGIVKTMVSFPNENDQYYQIISQLMNIAKPMLIDPTNWQQVDPRAGQLTEGILRGAYNDGDMLERLKIRMGNDVKNAFDKMPLYAKISYKSTSPDEKRQYTWRFGTNIVQPIIAAGATSNAICQLIKPINIFGWRLL